MMTSKEALENLVHCKMTLKCPTCKHKNRCTMERDYNTIKQDLERLKTLESNSDKIIKDIVKLINKNLELQQRLEVLEKENEQLKGTENIVSNYAYSLKEENEKLKKALKIIKNKCYSLQLTEATDEEFNLIKEVLGNA